MKSSAVSMVSQAMMGKKASMVVAITSAMILPVIRVVGAVGGSLQPQHEPIDQRQPHRRTSQGTERFSGNRNPAIHLPPLNRFQSTSTSTAGAVVCEADDFMSTMKEFDDGVNNRT
eukprot:scaffold6343_cov97-Skeletonema_dohrnii-CCMP3373.AAC.6